MRRHTKSISVLRISRIRVCLYGDFSFRAFRRGGGEGPALLRPGGEAAILNVKTGVYYGLNPVGVRVWKLIQQPHRVDEIRETLLGEYDVDPRRCEADLLELLEKFLAAGLIEVKGGASA